MTGAADPVAATVSIMEVVRGLGTLLQRGWKPLRTILIASWDGEEVRLSNCPKQTNHIRVVVRTSG